MAARPLSSVCATYTSILWSAKGKIFQVENDSIGGEKRQVL